MITTDLIIPFTTFQYTCAILLVLIGGLGVSLATFLLHDIIKRNNYKGNTIFALFAIIAGLFAAIHVIFTSGVNLYFGGFAFSHYWCIYPLGHTLMLIESILMLSTSVQTLGVVANVFGYDISTAMSVWIMSLLTTICAFVIIGLSAIFPGQSGMALQSGRLVCSIDFTNTANPYQLLMIVLMLLTASSYLFTPPIVYTVVYLGYRSLKIQNRRNHMNTTLAMKTRSRSEVVIFYRLLFISCAYLILWLPYLYKIVYELSTKRFISPPFDAIATVLVSLSNICLVFNFIILDAEIRHTLYSFFKRYLYIPKVSSTLNDGSGEMKKSSWESTVSIVDDKTQITPAPITIWMNPVAFDPVVYTTTSINSSNNYSYT